MKKVLVFLFLMSSSLHSENIPPAQSCVPLKDLQDDIVETHHKVKIDNHEFWYKALAGVLPIQCNNKVKAEVFFVSYTKDDVDLGTRPLMFCFNGGPGSSSVWLHLGLGPKRIEIPDTTDIFIPPYYLVDNEYSILDKVDLVFVDPVSTGFSKAGQGEDPKQFHGVQEDVNSITEFIRMYLSKYERWDSPKYLAGESYGTTRAASVALKLHEDEYCYLNGVILLSSILNFQTILDPTDGNDLPYVLILPTYTQAAWYYKKLPPELQSDVNLARLQAETFAQTKYAQALMLGDKLPEEERKAVVTEMSRLTGLSESYINFSNLRVSASRYAKELLRAENKGIGRFDLRVSAYNRDQNRAYTEFDPSMDSIAGAYTAGINQYIREDLKWKKADCYNILNHEISWNYNNLNAFLNVSENLREVMTRNPRLKVFVGSGYYDLATPYFATDYTFNHFYLPETLKKNIQMHYYDGGHMMYSSKAELIKLKKDLTVFFDR